MSGQVVVPVNPILARLLRAPALMALLFVMACDSVGWFDGLALKQLDFNTSQARHVVDSDLVIVEIDAASLKELNQWPWPRRYHARLLNRLNAAGVAGVFYDVDFSALSANEDDEQLAAALAGFTKTPVYLPAFVQPESSQRHNALIRSLPADLFRRHVTLAGVNIWPERDGLVRRINTSLQIGADTIWLAGAQMSGKTGAGNDSLLIDYSIAPQSFQRVSFADIINGHYDSRQLYGKQIIVGATAVELGDILPVPVYRALPGPVVQALAYQTLMEQPLTRLPAIWYYILLIGLAVLTGLLFRRTSLRISLLMIVVAGVALWYGSLHEFRAERLIANTIPHIMLLLTAFMLNLLVLVDKQRLRLLFQAFDLRRKDALMTSIVKYSHDGILTVTTSGAIHSANPAAGRLFGYAPTLLTNMTVQELVPILQGGRDTATMLQALAQQDGAARECEARRRDGKTFPVEVSANRIGDDWGKRYTLFVRDITERLLQRQTLEHLATHDSLTGLANRYYLHQRLEREFAGKVVPELALLLIDLDKFKEINDTLGHVTGDELLQLVAERLTAQIEPRMILARIGGDEFAVLVPAGTTREAALTTAGRIVTAMQSPFELNGTGMEIGASVGIAIAPDDGDDTTTLIKNADTALYVAKQGQSGVCAYRADFTAQSSLRMTILTNLRQAINESQLAMYYQPKLDIVSGRVTSLEALLRWHHPVNGMIPPDEIFDVAENTRMIWPLTRWTLMTAIRDVRKWRERGYELRVAVNLSARLLQDSGLVDKITSCLREGGIPADWLTLEITESAILGDPERALQNAMALQAESIQLSIDDFGTGYSSLSYIRNLPVDELKIDKSFVMDMLSNDNDTLIVKSTIELAHNLGIKVVAEGVESALIQQSLGELGCDYAQGYHISKPIAFKEMSDWLEAHYRSVGQADNLKAGNS